MQTENIATAGWYVASDEEWTILTNYLGGETVATGKLKEAGTTHWISSNSGATNEYGFSVVPGGYRDINGFIQGIIGYYGLRWSSTVNNTNDAWNRNSSFNTSIILRYYGYKRGGQSVKCVKE